MEYCGPGSVNDLMTIVQETLTEKQMFFHLQPPPRAHPRALICRDVLRGIKYLHEKKRIHRDIKVSFHPFMFVSYSQAGNILLNDDGEAKLADFGVSSNEKDFTKHHTVIGIRHSLHFRSVPFFLRFCSHAQAHHSGWPPK